MRGKAVNAYVTFLHVGITPAYAGKSLKRSGDLSKLWDHPRLCGEKGIPVFTDSICTGITPAYAGKRRKVSEFRYRR